MKRSTELELYKGKIRAVRTWPWDFLGIQSVKKDYAIRHDNEMLPLSGSGLNVAVIDTGLDIQNSEFKDRIKETVDLTEPGDGVSWEEFNKKKDMKGRIAFFKQNTFKTVSHDPHKDKHGTNIAAIIGGRNGILNDCNLYFAKIYPNWTPKMIGYAVYWALSRNVDLINISWAAETCNEILHQAVKAAFHQKAYIFCGTGNNKKDDDLSIAYPAAFQKTFAIGGYTKDVEVWGSARTGRLVDFIGPAQNIRTLHKPFQQGTSFATAFCTGIVGLFLQKWLSEFNAKPLYADLKQKLINRALRKDANKRDNQWGYGIIHTQSLFKIFDKQKINIAMLEDHSVIEKIADHFASEYIENGKNIIVDLSPIKQ